MLPGKQSDVRIWTKVEYDCIFLNFFFETALLMGMYLTICRLDLNLP